MAVRIGARQRQDFEKQIADTPDSAVAKGMFFDSLQRAMEQRGAAPLSGARYVSFKDYPLKDLMRLILDGSQVLYPESKTDEALRRLGQLVFPTLMGSMVGKVMFAVAGRSFAAALPLTEKAYNISVTGDVKLRQLGPGAAILELRGVWNFPDTYQRGVLEGAMESFHARGTVRAEALARPCDANLHLNWE
jgi:uncharacterized protein (TIGR02265 family)